MSPAIGKNKCWINRKSKRRAILALEKRTKFKVEQRARTYDSATHRGSEIDSYVLAATIWDMLSWNFSHRNSGKWHDYLQTFCLHPIIVVILLPCFLSHAVCKYTTFHINTNICFFFLAEPYINCRQKKSKEKTQHEKVGMYLLLKGMCVFCRSGVVWGSQRWLFFLPGLFTSREILCAVLCKWEKL